MGWITIPRIGLIVVQRGYGLAHWDETSKERRGTWRPSVDGDYATINRTYRGFDGEPWPIEPPFSLELGLADLRDLRMVREYYADLIKSDGIYDLVVLAPYPGPSNLSEGISFAGFDYGHGVEDDYRCSLLYNEVIFGLEPELRAFASTLNKHLLLDSVAAAAEIDETRKRLIVRGAAVEETGPEDPTGLIAIYVLDNLLSS